MTYASSPLFVPADSGERANARGAGSIPAARTSTPLSGASSNGRTAGFGPANAGSTPAASTNPSLVEGVTALSAGGGHMRRINGIGLEPVTTGDDGAVLKAALSATNPRDTPPTRGGASAQDENP